MSSGRCHLPWYRTSPSRPRAAALHGIVERGQRQVLDPLGGQAVRLAPERQLDLGVGVSSRLRRSLVVGIQTRLGWLAVVPDRFLARQQATTEQKSWEHDRVSRGFARGHCWAVNGRSKTNRRFRQQLPMILYPTSESRSGRYRIVRVFRHYPFLQESRAPRSVGEYRKVFELRRFDSDSHPPCGSFGFPVTIAALTTPLYSIEEEKVLPTRRFRTVGSVSSSSWGRKPWRPLDDTS